ncbi:MAG: hypothetical protein DWQ36_02580 [Acidobacteria bacterium]|nr:MAG: hypothetical protein DWQ30_23970 [Acidobacteriota bacterium]REK11324.1 MAG: hypothetical protein DWQ36_02580 [Acidobacteriota bacterium]
MRTLDLDWFEALDLLSAWQRLDFESQAALLAAWPRGGIERRALDPDTVEVLLAGGWCREVEASRLEIDPSVEPVVVALRAMFRAPVLHGAAAQAGAARRAASTQALDNYLVEHCTQEDLERLGNLRAEGRLHIVSRIAGSAWVLAFLHRDRPGALAGARRERYERVDAETLEVADRLIRILLEQGSPWALGDAYETFVEAPFEPPLEAASQDAGGSRRSVGRWRFADALHFVLREALVLIGLDDELRPFLGIWPRAATVIRRRRSAEEVDIEVAAAPQERWWRPQLMDDLVALLTECANDPPRVKANRRELFVKAEKAISERLAPFPAWCRELQLATDDASRVGRAVGTALGLGYAAAVGEAGRDLRLVPSAAARDWLSLPVEERLRALLEQFRADGGDDGRQEAEDERGDDESLDELAQLTRLLPHRPSHYYLWNIDFATPTLDAYRQLEGAAGSSVAGAAVASDAADADGGAGGGRWVDLELFLQQKAALNPIEEQLSPERLSWLGEAEVQRMWFLVLAAFFFERLLALGGAELGLSGQRICFRLCPPAAFLLGLSDEVRLPAAASAGRAVVQPNFEVVFLGPSDQASSDFAELAESTPAQRRGDAVGTLFEITRASIQRAASVGLSADELIDRLNRLSSQPLPGNVVQQVRAWCEAVHWVKPQRITVLRCTGPEAAARALAALGSSARLLTETVLELDSERLSEAQRRKLRAEGVFLDEG